ncbi:MAG: acyltransferase [Candidatus Saccharibacteria bacterium]|nr:acyltransferase [Rhodoferax sp.]
MLAHFHGLASTTGLVFFAILGNHGVTLFFVLSGFVLTHRYEKRNVNPRNDCRESSESFGWRNYAAARFARIVPVYWLSLIVTLIAYLFSGFNISLGEHPEGALKTSLGFAVNWLALQAWIPDASIQEFWNSPGWSISAEFFFYTCFPWLIRVRFLDGSMKSFFFVLLFFVLLLLVYLGILALTGQVTSSLLGYGVRMPLLGLLPFIFGILLCRRQHQYSPAFLHPSTKITFSLIAIFVITWFQADWLSTISPFSSAIWRSMLAQQLIFVPLLTTLIAALAQDRGVYKNLLASPPLVYLGNSSYAMYLFHWLPLCYLIHYFGPGGLSWGHTFLFILGIIVMSMGIYRWFEAPMNTWLFKAASNR